MNNRNFDQRETDSAAARALLGDELASPPDKAAPPPADTMKLPPDIPPAPLPDIPLEFGPDIAALRRGAAWCLAASGVVVATAALIWWQQELFKGEPGNYLAALILLLAALIHLNGLSLLRQIDSIHRAREHLTLSWFLFVVTVVMAVMSFVVFKMQILGGVLFATLQLTWLCGVGSFWTFLFGLRRVAVYVGVPRVITHSYLCQILMVFLIAASVVQVGTQIRARPILWLMRQLPESLRRSLATYSPILLAAAGVMILLYVHLLWLLWRACARAQRQTA